MVFENLIDDKKGHLVKNMFLAPRIEWTKLKPIDV